MKGVKAFCFAVALDPTTEGVKAPNIARYRMSPPVGVWAHLMDRVEAGLT